MSCKNNDAKANNKYMHIMVKSSNYHTSCI